MAPPIPQGSDAFGIPNAGQSNLIGPPGIGTDRGFFDEFVKVYGFDDLTSTGDESEVGVFSFVVGTHEVGDGDVLACGVFTEVTNAEAVFYFWDTSELGADPVSKVTRWSGLNDMIGNEAVDMERIEIFLFDMLNEIGNCHGGLFRVELNDDVSKFGREDHLGVAAVFLKELSVRVEERKIVEDVVIDRLGRAVLIQLQSALDGFTNDRVGVGKGALQSGKGIGVLGGAQDEEAGSGRGMVTFGEEHFVVSAESSGLLFAGEFILQAVCEFEECVSTHPVVTDLGEEFEESPEGFFGRIPGGAPGEVDAGEEINLRVGMCGGSLDLGGKWSEFNSRGCAEGGEKQGALCRGDLGD